MRLAERMNNCSMKKSVYLDTTIPSYLFDERESVKMHIDITRKWWTEERGNFEIWISDETINELSEGDYVKVSNT